MSAANKLIDKWMQVCSIKTQAEAAKRLGKSGSATISNWRSGYAKPDDESIALMCEQAGEDAAQWIGRLHLEFEESPRLRKVWLRLAQAAALMAGAYLLSHLDGQTSAAFAFAPLYIMRNSLYCLSSLSRLKPLSSSPLPCHFALKHVIPLNQVIF